MARDIKIVISGDSKKLKRELTKSTRMLKGFGRSASRALSIGIGASVGAVAGAAALLTEHAVKPAIELETAFRRVEDVGNLTALQLRSLAFDTRNMSDEFAIAQIELAGAALSALSAGTSFKDLSSAMAAAGKTASLESLAIKDVATLFALIKNVFPLYEFEQIADVMLRTQELGNIWLTDFIQHGGKVWQLTTDLGFSLEEVAGTLALLTSKGMTSEAAFTGIKTAFQEMINPLSKINQGFELAGYHTIPEMVDMGVPLTTMLKSIVAMMNTTGQTVYEVFGSQDAAAAFASMIANFGDLEMSIDELKGSTGEMAGQWENHTATMAFKWDQFKIRIQNSLIELGQTLLPWIEEYIMPWATKIGDYVQTIVEKFDGTPESRLGGRRCEKGDH